MLLWIRRIRERLSRPFGMDNIQLNQLILNYQNQKNTESSSTFSITPHRISLTNFISWKKILLTKSDLSWNFCVEIYLLIVILITRKNPTINFFPLYIFIMTCNPSIHHFLLFDAKKKTLTVQKSLLDFLTFCNKYNTKEKLNP